MPSKRCVTLAKRSEKCSSAPATNRMACQSRCEIQVQASHRRILSTCSRLSTPRNRAVWGLGCRSAGRSSTRTAADCGRARTCPAAPAFNSPCRRSQTLRRDAALVSRPKEQATRPRVPLWVKSGLDQTRGRRLLLPQKRTWSECLAGILLQPPHFELMIKDLFYNQFTLLAQPSLPTLWANYPRVSVRDFSFLAP